MAMWFSGMSNEKEIENKTLIYTTIYTKVIEPKAPWTLIENNLSKKKEATNLIAFDTKLACVLKATDYAINDYDSILFSDVV